MCSDVLGVDHVNGLSVLVALSNVVLVEFLVLSVLFGHEVESIEVKSGEKE